ncbi:hypothetical protein CA13_29390 [Planctomycetes bacterium CA13]|uniref:Uncharacterized protein n=2 Tax=Novipirellula herctigrandis TaxID=2527986 RepID=A0A5C5Z376_9BACT|nr:hypothetical protein CA13_29390 [Planctomycetes bacterium CA13]
MSIPLDSLAISYTRQTAGAFAVLVFQVNLPIIPIATLTTHPQHGRRIVTLVCWLDELSASHRPFRRFKPSASFHGDRLLLSRPFQVMSDSSDFFTISGAAKRSDAEFVATQPTQSFLTLR